MKFINESKPSSPRSYYQYGFDRVPRHLFLWSRLFQSVISQAVTYLLTGQFHDGHCGIYKAEGGCRIAGVGELVLTNSGSYFDYSIGKKTEQYKHRANELITSVVLNWEPENPIDSMIEAAAIFIKVLPSVLKDAVAKSSNGGPFSGNVLSSFFDWNPFTDPPEDREYERFCLINFDNWTDDLVTQKFADEDLGKELLSSINKKIDSYKDNPVYLRALCCAPRRNKNDLQFWINTGRRTVIDGWQTEKQIRDFLAGDGNLKNCF